METDNLKSIEGYKNGIEVQEKKIVEYTAAIEEKNKEVLSDKIEIIRVDLPFFVNKCYNENTNNLDYKDKFIGMIGITDKAILRNITKGEKSMEKIMKTVESHSKTRSKWVECEKFTVRLGTV